jgi:hypothetical protein
MPAEAMQEWSRDIGETSAEESLQAASAALSQESFSSSVLNMKDRKQVSAAIDRVFQLADKNHNGELSRAELIDAVENDRSIKGKDAQALVGVTVIADSRTNESWRNGTQGLTKSEIDGDFDTLKVAQRLIGRTVQAQQYSSQLYANRFFPALSIKPDDVKQGYAGTCEFLAPLASLAAQRPGEIPKLITDNWDGTYNVKFPYLKESIRVSAPTEAERGIYAQGSPDGTWPSVLEKAYRRSVQLRSGKMWTDRTLGETSTWNGGFQTLTGIVPIARNVSPKNEKLTDKQLHDMLTDATERNAIMEVGRVKESSWSSKRTEEIPSSHAYSILNYDSANKRLTIRNPWGRVEPQYAEDKPKDGKNDGVFTMSLDEFRKNFDLLMIE